MIRRLLLATLLLAPSVILAQRGGRTQADRKTPLFDKEEMPKGPALRVRDLEDQSPLRLLVDKRKDLKLTDAQVSQLKDAEVKLKEKNNPLFKSADSLLRDMRTVGAPTEQDRVRVRNARGGLMEVLRSLTSNNEAAAKEAVATLDAEQQPKANEFLEKLRQDSEKMVRDRLNAGERP